MGFVLGKCLDAKQNKMATSTSRPPRAQRRYYFVYEPEGLSDEAILFQGLVSEKNKTIEILDRYEH